MERRGFLGRVAALVAAKPVVEALPVAEGCSILPCHCPGSVPGIVYDGSASVAIVSVRTSHWGEEHGVIRGLHDSLLRDE
jgi:hypothetical protein